MTFWRRHKTMSHGIIFFEIQADDVGRAAKIMSNGGQIALEKFAIPGRCSQVYFIDTEGNTFGIFEVDEKAG